MLLNYMHDMGYLFRFCNISVSRERGHDCGLLSKRYRVRNPFVAIVTPLPLPSTFTVQFIVWGWAEKFIGWLMQRSILTKCGLSFNIVYPAVHTLLPSVLKRLDSRGIGALILILEKSSTADMTSSSIRYCFPAKSLFMLWSGTEIRWCQISRI